MRILYIGETTTHEQYLNGNVPSHWFYGAVEMERDGHDVIWTQERSSFWNDIKLLRKYKPDIVFIPNLNLHNHLLLMLLTSFGLLRIPVYAYLHHEPVALRGKKSKIYRQLFKGVRHLFFLSDLTMSRTVQSGFVSANKCSVPGWGPDMSFYNRIDSSDNGWFVSTGKENRDFDILIEAFKIVGEPLHIITANKHSDADYEYLLNKCKGISNIKVSIMTNSSANYPYMLREMATSKALVCPLRRDRLNYCVGLSTIADAEGLGKPLIITDNPYHAGRNSEFNVVTTVDDWVEAIKNLKILSSNHPTMEKAYCEMKTKMNLS